MRLNQWGTQAHAIGSLRHEQLVTRASGMPIYLKSLPAITTSASNEIKW
jgi:hypothetical protein